MKNATKALRGLNFKYNFTHSLKWALPYAGMALGVSALSKDSKEREPHPFFLQRYEKPMAEAHVDDNWGFIWRNGQHITSALQTMEESVVSVSHSEYQSAKKELQKSLSSRGALNSELNIIVEFLEENLSDSKLYVLDILNELGYNPLTYCEGVCFSLIFDLYERGKIDFFKVMETLKTFGTEDCSVADAISESEMISGLISINRYDLINDLIRLGYVSGKDIKGYELYTKFIQSKFSQAEWLERFSDRQITEVDHLLSPIVYGLCGGLSVELMRHNMKHEGEATIDELNNRFFKKLEDLGSDSSRLKRLAIYQAQVQPGLWERYHSIQRALEDNMLKSFFSSKRSIVDDSDSIISILDDVDNKYFLVCSESHATAVIKVPSYIGNSFYIFDPNFGVFKVNSVKGLLEIVDSLFLKGDICVMPMHERLQELRLIAGVNQLYTDKDSKNTYKLFEALYSSNIAEISRLSKIQNISVIGYDIDVQMFGNDVVDIEYKHDVRGHWQLLNMLLTPNILAFAMKAKSVTEDALFTLIDNSTSLDISDTVILSGILSRLLTYDKNKASDRVIDTLISHTSDPEAKKYLEMTKTCLRNGSLVPKGLVCMDENLIVDLRYDQNVEDAAKIVALIESNIDEMAEQVCCVVETGADDLSKMMHFAAKIVDCHAMER